MHVHYLNAQRKFTTSSTLFDRYECVNLNILSNYVNFTIKTLERVLEKAPDHLHFPFFVCI